ncbi:MAG: OpgC domain-containing protein [Geminicoccaceae bacterium]|nr:OpgC domain-containing protein [Geminicoccaceae bacterium]
MSSKVAHSQGPGKSRRDPRLDFFRGIAMLIILVAHIQWNSWSLWIPARFGPSDAAEMFVFCSGYAAAIAFGGTFVTAGFWMGVRRIALRCWQVYWAHLGLFFTVAAITVVANELFGTPRWNYLGVLNLEPFFDDTQTQLVGLFTLTYVPNYFDILPMYLVLLAMMPAVIGLASVSRWLALALVAGLWLGANFLGFALPAEPWSEREWFFNPFGWQLIFYTGFAFSAGWIPTPPVSRRLAIIAALIVLLSVPLAYFRFANAIPAIAQWRSDWDILLQKTDFGILRYIHFLAVAYLVWIAAGVAGHRLLPPEGHGLLTRVWRRSLAMIMKVGQQSLAVFIASMFLARLLGVVLDQVGRSNWSMLYVNLIGFALIIAVAHLAGWFKSHPWRKRTR